MGVSFMVGVIGDGVVVVGCQGSDVKDWKSSYLESQAERLRAERAKWLQGVSDAEVAMSKVASSGAGVDAAKASLRKKIEQVDVCVNKLSELMMATSQACDGVWSVQTRILECEQYAETHELRILRDGGVESQPGKDASGDDVKKLAGKVSEVLAYAGAVDQRYKMRMWAVATGMYASPETHKSASPGVYNFPQAEWSATEVAVWWKALSAAEKQDLIAHHPEMIGNLNGVDMASRDQANRILLRRKISQTDAEVQTLRAKLKEQNDPNASEKHTESYASPKSLEWAKKRLADLKAVQETLDENDKKRQKDPKIARRGLVYMDDSKKDDRVKVAISTGDVDRAKHVSTVIPGMDNVPSEDIKDHVENAELVGERAIKHARCHQSEVATIAWMYDTPQGGQVMSSKYATKASHEIGSALEGLHASRQVSGVGRAHTSLLGHSYGSMTAGKVAKMIRKGVLDDLVMYGSPGSGVKDAREYNLDGGRAYVSGVNTNDAVQGMGPDGTFGKDPMKMKGIKHLANNPDNDSIIKVYVSNSGVTSRYAVKGTTDPFARHSEYLEEGTESLDDISRVVVKVPVKGEK